jgi:hypothetical protein
MTRDCFFLRFFEVRILQLTVYLCGDRLFGWSPLCDIALCAINESTNLRLITDASKATLRMADIELIMTRLGKPLLPIPPSPKKKKKKPYKKRGRRGDKKKDDKIEDSVEAGVINDAKDIEIDDDKRTNPTDDMTELKPTGKVDETKLVPATGLESSESGKTVETYDFSMSVDDDLDQKPPPTTGSESVESGETVETYGFSMSVDDDLKQNPPPTTGSESTESGETVETYDFLMSADNDLIQNDDSKKIPPPQGAPSGDSTDSEMEVNAGTIPIPSSPVKLPGKPIMYWSENLKLPYFAFELGPVVLPHHKFPKDSAHLCHFKCTPQQEWHYNEYFANHLYKPLPPKQVVCQIGKHEITVNYLNTLALGEWLNDTIITGYLNLLGNTVYIQDEEDKNQL